MQLIYDVTIIYNLGTDLARGRGGQQVKKYIQFKIFPMGGGEKQNQNKNIPQFKIQRKL